MCSSNLSTSSTAQAVIGFQRHLPGKARPYWDAGQVRLSNDRTRRQARRKATALSQDLGSTVQLTLSHQSESEHVAGESLSNAVTAHSQAQTFGQTQTEKIDHQFGPSRRFEVKDATRAGTAPVSLPFDLETFMSAPTLTPAAHDAPQPVKPQVNRTYDRWGDVVSESDARSKQWKTTYTYSAAGQVLSQTLADGSTTRAGYDLLGHTVSLTDANSHTTAFQFDAAGNLIAETHADGGHVFNRFNAFGQRTETWTQTAAATSSNGLLHDHYTLTRYTYDLDNRLVQTIRPGADIEVVGTDAAGQYVKQDILGTQVEHWTTAFVRYIGDDPDRPAYRALQVGAAGNGNVETLQYDSLGRKVSSTVAAVPCSPSGTAYILGTPTSFFRQH